MFFFFFFFGKVWTRVSSGFGAIGIYGPQVWTKLFLFLCQPDISQIACAVHVDFDTANYSKQHVGTKDTLHGRILYNIIIYII